MFGLKDYLVFAASSIVLVIVSLTITYAVQSIMQKRPSGALGELIGVLYGIVPLISLGCAWVFPIFFAKRNNLQISASFFIAFMILIPVSHLFFYLLARKKRHK